ncbi:hypothetical protein WJ969_02350 [Achromobacter xylosoxidans]
MRPAYAFLAGLALLVFHCTVVARPSHGPAELVGASACPPAAAPEPRRDETLSSPPTPWIYSHGTAADNGNNSSGIVGDMVTDRAAFHAAVQANKHKADEDKIKRPPHFNQRLYPDTDATASHSKIGSSGERTASNIARKCESSAIQ